MTTIVPLEYDALRTRVAGLLEAGMARVRTLVNEQRAAGRHTETWDGRDDTGRSAAAGVYLYRFEAGQAVQTRTMTLVK